jgi:hypothetical protein
VTTHQIASNGLSRHDTRTNSQSSCNTTHVRLSKPLPVG